MSGGKPGFGPAEHASALRLIAQALEEDGARDDRTSQACVPREARARTVLRVRRPGVVAGLPCVELTLHALSTAPSDASVAVLRHDGDSVRPGEAVAVIEGQLRLVLAAERTFLNLVGLLSGVATLTHRYVTAAGPRCAVLDTRKTWPGGRVLQKYAVRCGGGRNHRMGLSDALLIKDNHRAGGLTLANAVRGARAQFPGLPLVVEVDDLEALREALALPLDRVLLDNFTPERCVEAVALRNTVLPRVDLEASGGVDLENVARYAAAGVDMVSVGALTHSAPALDVGLDWEPAAAP